MLVLLSISLQNLGLGYPRCLVPQATQTHGGGSWPCEWDIVDSQGPWGLQNILWHVKCMLVLLSIFLQILGLGKHFKCLQVSTTLPDPCRVKVLWLTKVTFMAFEYQAPLK